MEIKTIDLKGKKYAPVGERLNAFHEKYSNGSIQTTYFLTENGSAVMSAKIILDVDKPGRFFTGHSGGKLGGEKSLEKLETVAIGRGLAVSGFAPDGTIASYEEMEEYGK